MTAFVATDLVPLLPSPAKLSSLALCFPVVILAVSLSLKWSQRLFLFCVRSLFACFYKIRVRGIDNIPADGGRVVGRKPHIVVRWFDPHGPPTTQATRGHP